MRVLVCGGRHFTNVAFVWSMLDRLHAETPFTALMQGGADGADYLAAEWAKTKPMVQRYVCKADWKKHSKAAGPILLHYDPNTGILTWKSRTTDMFGNSSRFSAETQCKQWNTRYAGTIAGHPTEKGYLHVHVNSVMFSGHHLMWLIHTGQHPPHEIDHRDGDTSNNRFGNFRLAGPGENAQNRKINRNNTSGITGVQWIEKFQKWKATFSKTYLGLFESAEEAMEAYLNEKQKRHHFQPRPRYLP